MINLSTEALERHFDKNFVKGAIWYYKKFYFRNTGEIRDKYVLILTPKAGDGKCYFLLPSSKVQKLTQNRLLSCFVISKGYCSCFDRDTVVDVTNIQSIGYEDARQSYIDSPFDRKIEFVGFLDNSILEVLLEMIASSREVPKSIKEFVL